MINQLLSRSAIGAKKVDIWLWTLVVIAIICVSALAWLPETYIGSQKHLFYSLNRVGEFWPNAWANVTELGSGFICLPILTLLGWRIGGGVAALMWMIIPASLLSTVSKRFFEIRRPAGALDMDSFNIVGETLSFANSTPSGHTTTIFSSVSALLIISRLNRIRIPLLGAWALVLVAFLVGFSRISVGAHWPLDVVFGGCLGFVSGNIGARMALATQHRLPQWMTRTFHYLGLVFFPLLGATAIYDLGHLTISWAALIASVLVAFLLMREELSTINRARRQNLG